MEDTVCQPCSDDGNQMEAYGFCQDCGEYLCQDCYLGHCKPRPTRNHTLLDMDQLKKETPTKKKDTSNELCTQHGGEYIKYFCSTHNVTGCSACITIDHLNCSGNVVFIPQVAESVVNSEELQSLKRNIKSMRTPLTYMISTSADNIARVEANHGDMTTAILEYGEEISSTIQKLEKSSRNEADAFKQNTLDTANVAISKSKESLSALHDMTKELKFAEETGNNCKLFIAVKTYNKAIKDIQAKVKHLTMENKVEPIIFKPLNELRSFMNKYDGLGVFIDKPSSPDCSIDNSSSEPDQEETGPLSINASFLKDVYMRSATDQESVCQIASMVLMSENELILTDKKQQKVKLIDINRSKVLSELQFVSRAKIITPVEVVKVDKNRIVVRLMNDDYMLVNVGKSFAIDRLLISLPEPSCSGASEYRMSYCRDDELYICQDEHKIRKIDLNGNETTLIESEMGARRCFSGSLIKAREADQTCFYTVVTHRQYYERYNQYSDIEGKPYVACMTSDGEITDIINYENKPEDITIDETGRVIFVLSGGTVHVLEVGTTETRALWTKKDGLCRACAIAYCPDSKRLYVGMSDSNNIKVYQLSGMPHV